MDFASRIGVTCFAASYAIALANEVLHVFWQRKLARWLATAFAFAGILAHTLFLLSIVARFHRVPIATQFEALLTVSWLIGLIYLYLRLRDRRLAAGLFVLPVSLALVLYASTVFERPDRILDRSNRVLAITHGMLLLVGTVSVVVAFVAATMYLVKFRQLKAGTMLGGLRLPSLERLDRLNSTAVYIAWPLLTIGIGLGLALRELQWSDPKVVTSCVAWLLFTVLAHYRYQPENRGRKVAVLTIIAGLVVLVSVLGDPFFGTVHQVIPGLGL